MKNILKIDNTKIFSKCALRLDDCPGDCDKCGDNVVSVLDLNKATVSKAFSEDCINFLKQSILDMKSNDNLINRNDVIKLLDSLLK